MIQDKIEKGGGAVRVKPPAQESFAEFAFSELDAAPMHTFGVCYQPECSKRFNPKRAWAKYCCSACERAGRQELRTWGLRMAEAMLCHRVGKYDRKDETVMDRTKAARRYVAQVQSAWLADRQERMEKAMGERDE